ncbi:MAG: hypothetical protein J0I97_09680, partial [Microbacterium sp.]|nr:hypothetical protein [Microbacterium sp.]MBN9185716.1 hypothetical protein [Microbacterium sp.]
LVRGLVIALAVVWLLFLRPLSVGDIAVVVLTTLAVAWILEILQRRPGEQPSTVDAASGDGEGNLREADAGAGRALPD